MVKRKQIKPVARHLGLAKKIAEIYPNVVFEQDWTSIGGPKYYALPDGIEYELSGPIGMLLLRRELKTGLEELCVKEDK